MALNLPDPPASLPAAPRAFYDELRRMLAAVRPSRLDGERSWARFDRDGVEIMLLHAERDDWPIWVTLGKRDAIVGTASAHEHFFAPPGDGTEGQPWTAEAVDFIAEILRGQIEIETTFRGSGAISVRHFAVDEHGERRSLGFTAFLSPARLALWRAKRVETERVSFT